MDFNFFDPVRKKKKNNLLMTILINLFVLALGGTLVALGLSYYEYYQLRERIEEYNKLMGSESYRESLEKAIAKEGELKAMIATLANLAMLDVDTNMKHTINRKNVGTLSEQIPVNLSLDNININEKSISISGVATDMITIAQFQYYLRDCGLFENMFTSTISQGTEIYMVNGNPVDEYDIYSFSLTMNLQDVTVIADDMESEGEPAGGENAEE